jgi:hypothetical protein
VPNGKGTVHPKELKVGDKVTLPVRSTLLRAQTDAQLASSRRSACRARADDVDMLENDADPHDHLTRAAARAVLPRSVRAGGQDPNFRYVPALNEPTEARA